jgi:hypothetical protein
MFNNFYVYLHIKATDGTPFYVGKGRGDRCYSKSYRSPRWKEIVDTYGYDVIFLETDLTEEEAYSKEEYWIDRIGRSDLDKGTLINGNNGGQNITMTREEKCQYLIDKGYTYNPETGEVISPKGGVIKNKNLAGYLVIGNRTPNFILRQHLFAWYYIYKEVVECIDHINGIKDDNRLCNLRSVTRSQNSFNRDIKGYNWNNNANKWHSRIKINKGQIHLGYFNTEEEARQAYLEAKEKYHRFDGKEVKIPSKRKIKGYSWDKRRNKWMSEIRFNYKKYYLGHFDNEDDARQAYLNAKEKYYG